MLKSTTLQILQIVLSIKRQVKYTNNLMTLNKYCNINYEFFMIRMKVWTKNIEKTAILRCLLGLNVNIEHTLFFSLFFQYFPTAVMFALRMFY